MKLVERGALAVLLATVSACRTQRQEVGETERTAEALGEAVYAEAGCQGCHGQPGAGGQLGPDHFEFIPVAEPLILAAVMWNHLPRMVSTVEESRLAWPRLQPGDLESLLSYLRSVSWSSTGQTWLRPGNAQAGARAYVARGCGACHTMDPTGLGEATSPSLAGFRRAQLGPSDVAMAMWNAGPNMIQEMRESALAFPRLEWQELADLAAFLLSSDEPPEAKIPPPPP